ncbi:serine hydrolase [Nocardia miyunensis]|uniref:serine hydrolase n=1 Tax=Nocardia miyunensis TaxID=282684 RepID=UPI000831BFDF|nr:serine hydrolase [Nocardia miyunensis]
MSAFRRSAAVAAAVVATFALHMPTAPAKAPALDPGLVTRATAADAYAKSRPGSTGIVVYDRQTGAIWQNGNANNQVWAESTEKLEMVVSLLLRNESHAITLSASDRDLMHRMLNVSDDNAADALWKRYGGASFARDLGRFGMTTSKFRDPQPYWGWMRTTAADLDRLMNSALAQLNPADRTYLVNEMRSVGPVQQWGVWGAGPAAQPGNKDGWSPDNPDGSWLDNSVGFVGPNERYTVAITGNTMTVKNGDQVGRETATHVASILFQGYFH